MHFLSDNRILLECLAIETSIEAVPLQVLQPAFHKPASNFTPVSARFFRCLAGQLTRNKLTAIKMPPIAMFRPIGSPSMNHPETAVKKGARNRKALTFPDPHVSINKTSLQSCRSNQRALAKRVPARAAMQSNS